MLIIKYFEKGLFVAKECPLLILIQFTHLFAFGLLSLMLFPENVGDGKTEPDLDSPAIWVLYSCTYFVHAFILGGTIPCVGSILKNCPPSILQFMHGAKKHFLKLLFFFLLGTVWYILFAVVEVMFREISSYISPLLPQIMMIVSTPIVFYYASSIVIFSPYAIIFNHEKVLAAVKSSRQLANRNVFTAFPLMLLAGAMYPFYDPLVDYCMRSVPSHIVGAKIISTFLSSLIAGCVSIIGLGASLSYYFVENKHLYGTAGVKAYVDAFIFAKLNAGDELK